MTRILAVGTHPEVMPVVKRLIKSHPGWDPTLAFGASEALTALDTQDAFHLILLGAGLSPEEESILRDAARNRCPEVPVVAHYGGGSGLLFAEIWEVLGA